MFNDIITIGGVTQDINMYVDDCFLMDNPNKKDILRQKLFAFEYGAKINIKRIEYFFGGGANNAAINFSNLGFRTAIFASLGGDEKAENIKKNLTSHKVNIDLLTSKSKLETSFSFLVLGPDKEHVAFVNRSANKDLKVNKKVLNIFAKSKWLYITSLDGEWRKNLSEIFSLKNKKIKSPKIAWNPGGKQLGSGFKVLKKFFKDTEVLLFNKDEAIEILSSHPDYQTKKISFFNNIKNILFAIKEMGPKIVVITNGREGAFAYDGSNIFFQDIL